MALDIKLNVFEGPLDLLLHLIEKNKVDIYDIPIAEITEQYMEYIQAMKEAKLDSMSDFLVMAATLLKIKVKMLLPAPEEEEEEGDPREELVWRLIEYKIYKYASGKLRAYGQEAEKSFYKEPQIPEEVLAYKEEIDPSELLEGVSVEKLCEVFCFVMRRRENKKDPIRSDFGEIHEEEIKLEDKIEEIDQYIRSSKTASFFQIMEIQKTKEAAIVAFLSILELMKQGRIWAAQETIGGDIIIEALEQKDERKTGND